MVVGRTPSSVRPAPASRGWDWCRVPWRGPRWRRPRPRPCLDVGSPGFAVQPGGVGVGLRFGANRVGVRDGDLGHKFEMARAHFVAHSMRFVQIRPLTSAGFYENAADHNSDRPAASMMPSITSRNRSGSSRNTNRLAMKAPNISDDQAIRPFSAMSPVSAPKRSNVTDLLK